jgi:hypothetical protein
MEVNCGAADKKDTEKESKIKKALLKKMLSKKGGHSLQNNPKKQNNTGSHNHSLLFTTRAWEPLVSQNRQLILQSAD